MRGSAVLAAVLVAVFLALGAIHVYWAAGGKWGAVGAVPEAAGRPLFTPGPLACLAVAAALFAAAVLCAAHAGLLPLGLPPRLTRPALALLALAFAARAIGEFRHVGFFKKVRGTVFARRDSYFYSPLCAAIAAMAAGLAMTTP